MHRIKTLFSKNLFISLPLFAGYNFLFKFDSVKSLLKYKNMTGFKQLFLLLAALTFSFMSFSQEKLLTLTEISTRAGNLLYPSYYQAGKAMRQLNWIKNSDNYAYIKDSMMYSGSPKSKSDNELLSLKTLNRALEKIKLGPFKDFPQITWVDNNAFSFVKGDTTFVYDIKAKNLIIENYAAGYAASADVDLNSFNIAFTKDNNLLISPVKNDKKAEIKVSSEYNKDILYGQSVHRNEFGITKGTFWSPKGHFLAFYRMDQSMVSNYPIVNIDSRVADVNNVKYPMAGMPSHHVLLGVYNMETQKIMYMQTGEPEEQYLTGVIWSPDEKYIYIGLLNRNQNYFKLCQFHVGTGELVKTLFEEENEKYVEPLDPMIFFNTKPNQFLWFSKKDGYRHLYLYKDSGELIDQLTKGNFDVVDFIGFDAKEEIVYYRAVDENDPMQKQIYSININTKEVIKISTAEGTHDVMLTDDSKFIMDIYSNPSTPHKIDILDGNGLFVKTLYNGENPLKDYKLGETTVASVKADDGTDLYYRLIKPINFDPKKKYPVVVYVYGGPHSQMVNNSWLWGSSLWMQFMAEQGFVVFTLDNHGTSYRGQAFEQAVFRNLGDLEVKDQMKGINYLKTLPWIDSNRIGVHGWSYGGFMCVSLMLKQPNTFKVGVAGAPVIDWKYYEVMYGERYMDMPQDNPEGYKNANLLNYVKNLKGKLLLLHGTSDDTVVWQHTLKFIEECINEGKQVDYMVYPGQQHGFGGKARLNMNEKMFNYFKTNL